MSKLYGVSYGRSLWQLNRVLNTDQQSKKLVDTVGKPHYCPEAKRRSSSQSSSFQSWKDDKDFDLCAVLRCSFHSGYHNWPLCHPQKQHPTAVLGNRHSQGFGRKLH